MKMAATKVVVFKILFLVLIAHPVFVLALASSSDPSSSGNNSFTKLSNRSNENNSQHLKQLATFARLKRENLLEQVAKTRDEDESWPSEERKTIENSPETKSSADNQLESAVLIDESDEGRSEIRSPTSSKRSIEEATTTTSTPTPTSSTTSTTQTPDLSSSRSDPLASANYAELCYLSNGGSSLTLTVNEATQVGAIIGTVEVNGDPSLDGGNVDLSVAPEQTQQQLSTGNRAVSGGERPLSNGTKTETSTSNPRGQRQRFLSRRSLDEQQQLHLISESSAVTTNHDSDDFHTTTAANRATRTLASSSQVQLAAPPPPTTTQQSSSSVAAPLTSNQMLGLVSDYQSGSSSFYSLVASTAATPTPVTTPTQSSANLQQSAAGAAIRLEPGTKNLILVRALNKESAEHEQGLVVNVRCSARYQQNGANHQIRLPTNNKLQHQQPPQIDSTTIPVRIIVTDANDHAPEFVGLQQPMGIYIVNISETAPVGSVATRDILAIDRDSAGPFSTVHYRVLERNEQYESLNSNERFLSGTSQSGGANLLQFSNPLDPTLLVASQLDYETQSSFTLTILAQDQGEPEPMSSSAQVQVNIIDFDDQNPKFLDEKYTLLMDETQQSLVGQNLQILPRNLYAEDGDRGINAPILYSFDQLGGFQQPAASVLENEPESGEKSPSSQENEEKSPSADETTINVEHYLHLNPTSGEIRLIRQWPSKWLGAPITLVVRATQADNKDRYTLTTLTISRSAPSSSTTSVPSSMNSLNSGSSLVHSLTTTKLQSPLEQTGSTPSLGLRGIQFAQDKLSVQVSESVPINEKIAKVKAYYLDSAGTTKPDQSLWSSEPSSNFTDTQTVDLIKQDNHHQQQLANKSKIRRLQRSGLAQVDLQTSSQAHAQRRPINYQILDDQTEQFGINGLGEVFVKRALDFELKQEYKFRVLATYTKYSDICQVQVNVLNVNDNKPKFTQQQYTFHLTESRLRSNAIGSVLAHDLDLNDSLRYELVPSSEHAHLFEINPQSGQIALRSSIKQLNISQCQLIVQVTDSLGPGPHHSHQARVNLHIAPQLIGRSINFDQPDLVRQQGGVARTQPADLAIGAASSTMPSAVLDPNHWSLHQHQISASGRIPNSARNLVTAPSVGGNYSSKTGANLLTVQGQTPPASSQRSSVATVMSSLQHMVRSVNFLEMPMSSALLLSALLAFLICLLFIVIISMSVHLYRRRSKQRHRRQLASAAHMRHAHMTAGLHQPQGGVGGATMKSNVNGGGGGVAQMRYLSGSQAANVAALGQQFKQSAQNKTGQASGQNPPGSLSVSSQSCSNSSPTNSTTAGNSPNYSSSPTQQQQQQHHQLRTAQVAFANVPFSKLTARVSPVTEQAAKSAASNHSKHTNKHQRTASASNLINSLAQRTNSRQSQHSSSLLNSLLSELPAGTTEQQVRLTSPLEGLNNQLESSAHLIAARANILANHHHQQQQQKIQDNSLISSLSGNSKRSYRSNTTEDSSVMQCGHYSVNSGLMSPLSSPQNNSSGELTTINQSNGLRSRQEQQQRSAAIEAAIKSLVREEEEERAARADVDEANTNTYKATEMAERQLRMRALGDIKLEANEFSVYRSDAGGGLAIDSDGKLGIKSYRKLPLNSLVRPFKLNSNNNNSNSSILQEQEQKHQQDQRQDSAIASDASSSSASNGNKQPGHPSTGASGALMAMIRNTDRRKDFHPTHFSGATNDSSSCVLEGVLSQESTPLGVQVSSPTNYTTVDQSKLIRWPQGTTPTRVKKLTWDDELSCISTEEAAAAAASDCFVAPDMRHRLSTSGSVLGARDGGGCISPLSNHQYPIQGTTNSEDHYAEQHFLFSNPCSPALISGTDFASITQDQQQQHHQFNSDVMLRNLGRSMTINGDDPASMMANQDNCFDYTIVQSSQFQVDAFASERLEAGGQQQQQQSQHQPSLSAQHHLLQQKQRPASKQLHEAAGTTSYLYSNSFNRTAGQQQQLAQTTTTTTDNHNQDLNHHQLHHQRQKLMTTAVL